MNSISISISVRSRRVWNFCLCYWNFSSFYWKKKFLLSLFQNISKKFFKILQFFDFSFIFYSLLSSFKNRVFKITYSFLHFLKTIL